MEQRYFLLMIKDISITEIYYKTNTIQVNSVPVAFPFTIKAIGNSDALEEGLNIKWLVITIRP